jgi:phosphatidylinositol alpha-1,6-mannosyltransferase
MVLLEAQACGKPVVAGLSGGTIETMSVPDTGRVVSCDKPQRMAALVIELLSNPTQVERMGARARQWVVEQFDWRALCDQATLIFRRPSTDPRRNTPVSAELISGKRKRARACA